MAPVDAHLDQLFLFSWIRAKSGGHTTGAGAHRARVHLAVEAIRCPYRGRSGVGRRAADGGSVIKVPPLPSGAALKIASVKFPIMLSLATCVLNTNPLSQIVTNQEQFLAHPHHG